MSMFVNYSFILYILQFCSVKVFTVFPYYLQNYSGNHSCLNYFVKTTEFFFYSEEMQSLSNQSALCRSTCWICATRAETWWAVIGPFRKAHFEQRQVRTHSLHTTYPDSHSSIKKIGEWYKPSVFTCNCQCFKAKCGFLWLRYDPAIYNLKNYSPKRFASAVGRPSCSCHMINQDLLQHNLTKQSWAGASVV